MPQYILSSHNGDYVEQCLLERDSVYSDQLLTFLRNILPPVSGGMYICMYEYIAGEGLNRPQHRDHP
jgi:hypothetical protein